MTRAGARGAASLQQPQGFWALMVMCWLLPGLSWAGELLQPRISTIFHLVGAGTKTTLHVPVRLVSEVSALEIAVLEARFGNTQRPELRDAFQVKFVPGRQMGGPRIELIVPLGMMQQQGTYDVTLLIEQSRAMEPVQQELKLQLVRPEARIQQPSTLRIENECVFPLCSCCQGKETLAFSELSRLSEVTLDSSIISPATSTEGRTAPGEIKIGKLPMIPRGGTAGAEVSLTGRFPCGISTGSIQVNAPQLQGPITIPYEVRTRVTPWWIIGLALLGMVMGAALRNWIGGFIDKRERDRAKKHARRVTLHRKLEGLLALINGTWYGPQGLKKLLMEQRSRAETARSIVGSDVEDAEKEYKAIVGELKKGVEESITHWSPGQKPYLLLLGQLRLPSKQAHQRLQASIKAAERLLEQLNSPAHEAPLRTRLEQLDGAARKVQDVYEYVFTWLTDLLRRLVNATQGTEAGRRLTDLLARVVAERALAHALPDEAIMRAYKSHGLLDEVRTILRTALDGLAEETRKQAVQKVNGFLDKDEYVEAASLVAATLNPATATKGEGQAEGRELEPTETVRADPSPLLEEETLETSDMSSKTDWSLRGARLLQWGLSAVGIVIFGYILFEQRFVGGPADVATVFLWGFAADVSIEALLAKTRELQPTGAAR